MDEEHALRIMLDGAVVRFRNLTQASCQHGCISIQKLQSIVVKRIEKFFLAHLPVHIYEVENEKYFRKRCLDFRPDRHFQKPQNNVYNQQKVQN